MTSYPSALDALTNPTGANTLDNPNHADQHANANDAIEAIQTKVGVDGSAVTTSHDYKLSGVTGSDKAVSKAGTETLTNKTITAPVLSGTATGTYTLAGTPTITAPVITNPTLTVDTVSEFTGANGVTVDGLNIKDSKLVTADSVVTANITDEAVTASKIANRTRNVMFNVRADGIGGAVEGTQEGSPETAFTGTPSGYMRGHLIMPSDYVSGTTATIKVVMRPTNTATHSSVHYVGARSSATTTAWSSWNEQSGVSTGSLSFVANQMYTQSMYTIPSTNLSANAFIAVAYRISTAITGTIYGLAIYLEYTADS